MSQLARFRPALRRVAFALLVSAVTLVFSEKMYWYVTGYNVVDLLVGYFFPSWILLWLIDAFHVRRVAARFLAAAVVGFVGAGAVGGRIYGGGLVVPPRGFVGGEGRRGVWGG